MEITERLRPMLTMADIYGADHVYVPRPHRDACEWLSHDAGLMDSLSGAQFIIAGGMRVLCNAGVASPQGLALIAEAGLTADATRLSYRDEHHLGEILFDLAKQRRCKLVLQHVYPDDALRPDAYWIGRALLSYLNNKKNLAAMAPATHVPRRSVVSRQEFFSTPLPELPFVLKVVTDQSSGGGAGVVVCRTPDDVAVARDRLARCGHVVVEAFHRFASNLCMSYAVMPDATVRYLGYAEQDVAETGKHRGNWIERGAVAPQNVIEVGREVVQRAAGMGYRGVAGIDIAVLDDGQVLVVDLNFRVNASTATVLLAPSIFCAHGEDVMHLRRFSSRESFEKMLTIARPAVRHGRLLPLTLFHPIAGGHPTDPPRMTGIVLGHSRQDVLACESELLAAGLGSV